MLLLGLILALGSGVALAAEKGITLKLDGAVVATDVPPVIENGRTLVPYRAVLESMGAEVSWEPEAKMATAVLGSHRVQVTIDNATGFVNGVIKKMDVPPRIIDGRTMIPVRFVLENLSCQVDWEPETRAVLLTSPAAEKPAEIVSISMEEGEGYYRVIAQGNDIITEARSFAYENPERFGVDVGVALYRDGSGKLAAENEVINGVRFSQFDGETVRVVMDLNNKVAGRVSLSPDRTAVYIDFPRQTPGQDPSRGDGAREDLPSGSELPELDWRAAGKLIAIDAGHGGKDPGAEGKQNGSHAAWEKDLNLSVALRVFELLQDAGANVVLLRDIDIAMGLYERPEAANLMNADLLVSIHHNSAETTKPNGVEVLYFNKEGEEAYGMSSHEIGAYIQAEIPGATGLADRGIKSAPHLAVLNKSLMPAVIVEGGFLSNPLDLEIILSDGFVEAYAASVAKGLINALNAAADQ